MRTTCRNLGAAVASLLLLGALAAPAATAAELAPVNGFDPLVQLVPGDTGDAVALLQKRLADAGFYRRPVDGEYGHETEMAVLAFHKYLDLERTTTWNSLDWIRIALLPDAGLPIRLDEPDRVEVDIGRQLVFVIRRHEVVGVLHSSTGGSYTYYSPRQDAYVRAGTPRGDFTLNWRQYGWVCDQATGWCVYKYWEFTPFYGIHGYLSVPAYPASHGCVRVNVWDSDWLDDQLFIGMPVHVWDVPPELPPPEHDPAYEPDLVGEPF
ncbi:MAG TPA: L,D-transpeptidase family protein [Acidimicrobiia bacterium]|nr:L,D-transpeptidase family protein [Acidimicrobiia bacterium]